jgi:WD40 repeat protein
LSLYLDNLKFFELTLRAFALSFSSVEFSPDGAWLLSTFSDGNMHAHELAEDRSFSFTRLHSGSVSSMILARLIPVLVLTFPSFQVSSARWDPMNTAVISAGHDGVVRLWSREAAM